MNLDNSPLSVKPLLTSRHGFQVGRYHYTFTKAAFYSEPPLPCPCDPHGELAVRYANISPTLSLAVGGCGKPLLEKTPVQSLPVLSSGRATVSDASHNLGKHKKCANIRLRMKDRRYGLHVALLAKVRCRGLPPRLKDSSMFCAAGQA
jgi:hypothetical protein